MEELKQRGKSFIYEWSQEENRTTKWISNEFYEGQRKVAYLPLNRSLSSKQLKNKTFFYSNHIAWLEFFIMLSSLSILYILVDSYSLVVFDIGGHFIII